MSIEVASGALVSKKGAADMLGVSTQTIDRYRRRGRLSPVQIVPRGRVRYRVRDLQRLLGVRPPFPPENQAAVAHGSYRGELVLTAEPRTQEIFDWIEETQPVAAPCDRLTMLRLAVVYRRTELAVAAIDEADRLTAERPIAAYAVEREWMPRLRADLDRWMSRATSLERELGRTPASRARLGLDIASARRAMTVVDLHEAAAEEAS